MQRHMFASSRTDPDVVFENMEWTRVKVELEESDRKTAINAIQDIIKNIQDNDDKSHAFFLIAYTIRQQLFKSKKIDVETIKKLAAWYPRCVEIDDDDHSDFERAKQYEKLFPEAVEEEDDDDDDDGFEEYYEEDEEGKEKGADDNGNLCDFKKREAAMKEFEEAGMNELKLECDIMECSLKQGQEQEILSQIISFFCQQTYTIDDSYTMRKLVRRFMARVNGYISSTCTLKDLGTVKEALESVKKRIENDEAGLVHEQQVEKNTAPTNEEGNEREIATPFSLPEQDEICLTAPECEGMKTKEYGTATPMNQPEQEKNMVDVNLCFTPKMTTLWEDMKTEECAIWGSPKRKLAQL